VQLGGKNLIGCKLGLPNKGGINLGAGESFEEERICINLVYSLCVSINPTCGAGLHAPNSFKVREKKREPCLSLNPTEGAHSPFSLTLRPYLSEISLILSLRPMHTRSMQIEGETQFPAFPLDLLLPPRLLSDSKLKMVIEENRLKNPFIIYCRKPYDKEKI
jgi:hypothetical protein